VTDAAKRLAIQRALDRFRAPPQAPLELLAALVDALRPRRAGDASQAIVNVATAVGLLEADRSLGTAVRAHLLWLFARRRQTAFFADSGILPATGFFTEVGRQLVDRVLPEVPDPLSLRDAPRIVFGRRGDHEWLAALPTDLRERLWRALQPPDGATASDADPVLDQMLEALVVLGHRVSAMGTDPELTRLHPELLEHESPFIALAAEAQRFAEAYRRAVADPQATWEDERQVMVLLEQCREVLRRARRTATTRGTSLRLTFILRRAWQSLARIAALAQVLATRFGGAAQQAAFASWIELLESALRGERERRSLRLQFARLTGLLALRVTDNAAQTGEHYVTSTRREYLAMWRSAMGAGLIIGVLALDKILAAKLGWAPLNQAFVYSMNYALGFVLIYLLGFTIATKQPAMTAQTIAAALGEMDAARGDLDKLIDLIAGVARSQVAAILGNVLVAFPTAIAIGWALGHHAGRPFVDAGKAAHLLHELHPLASLAIPHAAVAGVCLFLSGLISGYFDNLAVHAHIPERVARLRWLRRLVGDARAGLAGGFVERNLGGLAGNFFFGIMLGSIGTIAGLFGLPIDIRHIAFAAANLGYALVALDFALEWHALAWCIAGVALIGFTNLAVSFALALWVALKARGVAFGRTGELLRLLWREFVAEPTRFLLPPRGSRAASV
jgi:site-specific recombinase